jgi:hypothetical protein
MPVNQKNITSSPQNPVVPLFFAVIRSYPVNPVNPVKKNVPGLNLTVIPATEPESSGFELLIKNLCRSALICELNNFSKTLFEVNQCRGCHFNGGNPQV